MVKNSNQQRFGTNNEEVDALHEQYEAAVEDNESDDDQMLVHRTTKMRTYYLYTHALLASR
jgi:hypothetical protein